MDNSQKRNLCKKSQKFTNLTWLECKNGKMLLLSHTKISDRQGEGGPT